MTMIATKITNLTWFLKHLYVQGPLEFYSRGACDRTAAVHMAQKETLRQRRSGWRGGLAWSPAGWTGCHKGWGRGGGQVPPPPTRRSHTFP